MKKNHIRISEAMKLLVKLKNLGNMRISDFGHFIPWWGKTGKCVFLEIIAITFPFLVQFGPNLKYSLFITFRFE